MLPVSLMSPDDVARQVADNARAARLTANLSQEGLAQRAGVSLGSLKRFEHTGAISFESLIRIAMALDLADPLPSLLLRQKSMASIDEMMAVSKSRLRGRKK